MKKISILALTLMMIFSMIGCRRKEETRPTQTTPPATQEVTTPSIMPTIDPTMGTNIPDPTVDSNSNQMDDSTTNTTDSNNSDENSRARFRMR